MTVLSGQRHAPHRTLKPLVRTDKVGGGRDALAPREPVGWVREMGERHRCKGAKTSKRWGTVGMRKRLGVWMHAKEEDRETERAGKHGRSHVTNAAR